MGSNARVLPVIDFSSEDLKPGTPSWNSVKDEVRTAFEEFGCFKALYNKIPKEIRKAFFDSSKELFDLPTENKVRCSYSDNFFQDKPLPYEKESMVIEKPTLHENIETFTNIIWPQGNSDFSKTLLSYAELVSELDKTIRRMVLESLGLEKYMDEHLDSSTSILKLSRYFGPQTNEAELVFHPHTDKNILTILDQNRNGLEVQTKDGQWIEVDFPPNSVFVIVADCFHAWTNGRLYSPYHRVMLSGNDSRYIAGLFSYPKGGYMVKAPEELVDEEHPLLFRPFDHAKLIAFCDTEAGHKTGYSLKAYCGV